MKNFEYKLFVTIESNIKGVVWEIEIKSKLSDEDKQFIREFNPSIYFDNISCQHYALDVKLPSGRWLENISFNNEISIAAALVL